MNLIDFFDKNVRNFPQRKGIVYEDRAWTYAELDPLVLRIAHGLAGSGVGRETPCAVISRNHPLAFMALLGILKARGSWVPLNTGNAEEDHLYVLGHFDVHVLFYQKEFAAFARQVKATVPCVKHFICIDGVDGEHPDMQTWMSQQNSDPVALPWDPDGMCMLRGTGGTTGRPKGVMNTNRNFEVTLSNYMARMHFDEPPIYLAAAPLSHAASVFAFVNMGLGGTLVILPKFDADAVMQAIQRHRVSWLYLPPTAVYSLLSHPDARRYDYSSLRYFVYGAAPMSAAKLAEAIGLFGKVMTQAYGQTEAPAGITYLGPEEHLDRDGNIDEKRLLSCGRPDPFTRVALMDDDGNFVPRGEIGEIVVQGGIVMRGYYKNPEASAEVSRFGWHHTGDLAYEDEDGYLYICDRKKEMIISGGFNVFPLEVEQVILAHPAVQDCAVVGVPDEKWGEAVKAVVELKTGQHVSAEELIANCRARLGAVKTPKTVDFMDELPRSSVGKVMRRAVRDRYWTGQARRV
ncbi:class I adenylate-forming enzyme family protein [Hydrogenophaga sp. ANAO-22]|uniref:class I adenylate-forming enzyme family protein n=1 Tax=unclassified Hydrogenophaga TaxID=2610897 RepID=UPI0036D335C4